MKSKAKSMMLKELSKAMSDDQNSPIGDMMKGKKMQKVTVMSDSPEGIKKGLSKAEQIMQAKHGSEPEMGESMDHEASEAPEMEASEDSMPEMGDDMSKEHIMAMIEMLQKKLENC